MKNKILTIVFYLMTTIIYANDDYYVLENILINRGYTKFDPEYEFDSTIFDNCYYEIFQRHFIFDRRGRRRITLDVNDGFEYRLHYIREEEDLPNILVFVYLRNNEKNWGFYKKNLALEGTIIYIESLDPEEYIVAFF